MILSSSVFAQNYGQDKKYFIWDNASAPHSNKITVAETNEKNILRNVTKSELYVFKADESKKTDKTIVICPGGGYACLCMSYEGYEMAEWLSSQGITAAVLKYRMPNGNKEVPLEDAVEAIRILKKNAKELNISPDKIGIMGFSAGGHLAAYTSNFAPDKDKPAFSVLFYPVITGKKGICHKGSFDYLLGEEAGEDLRIKYSLEECVSPTTPPALILVSDGDQLVPPVNSTLYYNALKKYNIKASLHVYPGGFHGWGNHFDFEYSDEWRASLLDWLKFLDKKE